MAKSLETVAQISGEECRVCLKRCTETCQLFDSSYEIARKLMAVAAVQVEEGDGLPNAICNACNQLLDTSYDFRCQIQSSDSKLRRLLHLGSTTEQDTKSSTIVKAIIADVLSTVMCYKPSSVEDQSEFLEKQLIKQEAPCPPKGEQKYETHCDGTQELSNRLNVNCSDDEEKPLISRTSRQRCAHCIKSFSTKLALQRHMMVHQRKTKLRYVCYACDKQFSNVGKLKSHVFSSHNGAKEKRTSRKDSVPEKRGFKFTCKVCSKQFTYQKSFVTHAKSHSEYEQEIQEDDAHVDRVEVASDKSEKEALTVKELKEEDAEEEAEEEEEEEDEEEEEEEEDDGDLPAENLQCTQCGKLFATKRNLKRHISTHSGLKFNCTTCGKGFSRVDKLKDHEQSKHKEEIFGHSEDEDEDGTDNENKVYENLENRKKERHNRPHKCAICPKAFAQAQSLANHMERHKRVKETQKRFLCEVCSKCFAQSGSLVAHMRTHTGVKPYVCNVCSRAFTKSTYLQLHLRTHSGEKPYICQYCSRAFARANTLARHITMHTGEAKYHCQICTKSFRRLTSLNEHTYTHTGQRPYACKICTKRYNNAGSLYAHTKKCKAQHLPGSTAAFAVSVDNSMQQNDGPVPQVVIYSQRKLIEEAAVGQGGPTPQYMIANVHNQKALNTNVVQPFAMEDPNVYAVNAKQFKNPYYAIYPNM